MKRSFLFAIIFNLITFSIFAQNSDFGLWTNFEASKKIAKRLSLFSELELRSSDNVATIQKWSASVGTEYNICKYLKLDGAYSYIRFKEDESVTNKGNNISSYWGNKHRFELSLIGKKEWKRFEFSLRERWQYTYKPDLYVQKYNSDFTQRKDDEYINSKSINYFCSRAKIEYDIKKSCLKPYISYEIYVGNDGVERTKYTIGSSIKINKRNSFDIFYRYNNKIDDDETNSNILSIAYKLKF